VEKVTRLDKILNWIKNNRFFSILLFVGISITAVSQVFSSLETLKQNTQAIFSGQSVHSGSTNTSEPTTLGAQVATVALTFGSKGTGPGFLQQTFGLAVDGQGVIYVADYMNTGRVQRFDPDGRFKSQWIAEKWQSGKDSPNVYGIAVDDHNVLHVARSDGLFRFAADSGKLLSMMEGGDGWTSNSVSDVKINAKGEEVAVWAGKHLVLFDVEGHLRQIIKDAVTAHTQDGDDFTSVHLSVDGIGNIYLIGGFGTSVLKFSQDGAFLTRFGGPGNEPGQFNTTWALAVNGKGDVYVSDQSAIQVFDSNGRYLKKFRTEGPSATQMAFDNYGGLYTISGERVVKYRIAP
jgi:hypothetical protein